MNTKKPDVKTDYCLEQICLYFVARLSDEKSDVWISVPLCSTDTQGHVFYFSSRKLINLPIVSILKLTQETPASLFSCSPLLSAIKLTVDSGKALDDDGASSQVPWLQGSMLSAGSLAVVFVSNHHPVHSISLDKRIKQIKEKSQQCAESSGEKSHIKDIFVKHEETSYHLGCIRNSCRLNRGSGHPNSTIFMFLVFNFYCMCTLSNQSVRN